MGILMVSCELNELDNYAAPDAQLFGYIIDSETGEYVTSELFNGSTVSLTQLGYENPTNIYLKVDMNGKYENDLVFGGQYRIKPYARNYIYKGTGDTITISGHQQYDFNVVPFVRFIDPSMTVEGQKVKATFKIKNNLAEEGVNINKIALFLYDGPMVGSQVRNAASKIMTVDTTYDPDELQSITLNLPSHMNDIQAGKTYYFRLGALSSYSGAVYNFSNIIPLKMPDVITEETSDGVMISDCDFVSKSGVGAWSNNGNANQPNVILDGFDCTQGEYSVKFGITTNTKSPFRIQYKGSYGVKTGVTKATGILKFDMYVSDAEALQLTAGQIEITSSGKADSQEIGWNLPGCLSGLQTGWNHIELALSDGVIKGGEFNPDNVNWFRFYASGKYLKDCYIKIDNLRMCTKQ